MTARCRFCGLLIRDEQTKIQAGKGFRHDTCEKPARTDVDLSRTLTAGEVEEYSLDHREALRQGSRTRKYKR